MGVQCQGIFCEVSARTMVFVAIDQLLGVGGATEIDPSDYVVLCTRTRTLVHHYTKTSNDQVTLCVLPFEMRGFILILLTQWPILVFRSSLECCLRRVEVLRSGM